jgi:hypothetical protein
MAIEERERYLVHLRDAWKALARDAKASCEKSIRGIAETNLSDNPEWDADFKVALKKAYEDGYERFLVTIIECADREA